ncbi:MAG: adaptin domain-containing protein, partial [archaeon]|nr:adaptin domain-containing protein [archaeon]
MFKKDLSALVKGIRSHKKDEQTYIEAAINEMKKELKDPDVAVKANAIEKLTYLQMFGYSMDWAAFNIIEVMTSSKFTHKRIGYLAASQSWKEDTDVILLSTNLLKKDIAGAGLYEAGVALNCLANICTKDLARDIASDLVALLNTSRPYIRKKAILCLFRIFLKFPQALRPAFPRLREKLEDPEMPVVSAAVNVICELARKNPKNYLQLSQTFFRILTSSNNNWMLIKIIKLFGALTPLEKRLGKKLAEPLTNIINTTPATSLLYEAIQTCIIGLSHDIPVMRLCITKLRDFIVDPDQNLKYLGLLALHKIMQVHPKAVNEHRDTVIRCLDDPDTTIRSRALDLVSGMVSRRNIMDIIQKLVEKIDVTDDPVYKDDLVEKCIEICSQNNTYSFITDFDWYIQVLLELTHVRNTRHGNLISAQLLDVVTRVKVVRSLAVRCMADLLKDSRLVIESPDTSTLFEVLHAAAYICGEYAELVEDPHQVMEGLLQPRVLAIAPHLQAIFMQNVLKLFAFVVSQVEYGQGGEGDLLVEELITLIRTRLEQFVISSHTEVPERACFA